MPFRIRPAERVTPPGENVRLEAVESILPRLTYPTCEHANAWPPREGEMAAHLCKQTPFSERCGHLVAAMPPFNPIQFKSAGGVLSP